MTIQNFKEHAANERTFLAWIRTSIAMTGYGLLIERLDVFIGRSSSGITAPRDTSFGHVIGLGSIACSIFLVILAAARFVVTRKRLNSSQDLPSLRGPLDLILAALLVSLGLGLFLYLLNGRT
ncbi:YidH family protein [Asticcacaulis solisilvae]|uniref:YidH family protein n=1 Tax=Asticcacaulis solisilvae TaxID=1217274 RepID=UPI003FD8DA2B